MISFKYPTPNKNIDSSPWTDKVKLQPLIWSKFECHFIFIEKKIQVFQIFQYIKIVIAFRQISNFDLFHL